MNVTKANNNDLFKKEMTNFLQKENYQIKTYKVSLNLKKKKNHTIVNIH